MLTPRSKRRVSVIVPCYNEENTILEVVKRLLSVGHDLDLEIILVDDGSTDSTFDLVKNQKGVRIAIHEINMGKGTAVLTGAAEAKGDVIVIQDGDLEYCPEDIPALVEPILQGECDIVFGSRFMGNAAGMSLSHYLGNKILTWLTHIVYGGHVTDVMTGHKAIKAEILRTLDLSSSGFEFELELTVKALEKHFTICEVPIVYSVRRFGEAKIRWIDGVRGLLYLLKPRISRRRNNPVRAKSRSTLPVEEEVAHPLR